MARKNKARNIHTETKAAARKAHFESGGSASKWMGKGARHKDNKKARNKSACRQKVQW